MDLQAIIQYLEANKDKDDVKAYLSGLKQMSVEEVQKYLSENQDGKRFLDSEKDKHFNKGLETWMQKTFPSKLEEEIKKRYPDEDPKDKEINEIRLKLQQMEQDKTRESIKSKLLTAAQDKKIPVSSIIDMFIGADEQSSMTNLDKFKEVWDSHLTSAVDERLKSGGNYTPPNNNNSSSKFTLDQIKAMSSEEINANWTEVQAVLSASKTN